MTKFRHDIKRRAIVRGVPSTYDRCIRWPGAREPIDVGRARDQHAAYTAALDQLGFELPQDILDDAWVEQLDMRRLFAWCVFSTYRRFCDDYYLKNPLASQDAAGFDDFLQACGFHTLDITPCADGRLAHVVRYVLRLPQESVRRKSYAGALFDIEDSIQKWIKVEIGR